MLHHIVVDRMDDCAVAHDFADRLDYGLHLVGSLLAHAVRAAILLLLGDVNIGEFAERDGRRASRIEQVVVKWPIVPVFDAVHLTAGQLNQAAPDDLGKLRVEFVSADRCPGV